MTKYAPPELEMSILRELRGSGPVESAAGQATHMLAEYAGIDTDYGRRLVGLALRQLERAQLIERDVRGGRTYRIAARPLKKVTTDG